MYPGSQAKKSDTFSLRLKLVKIVSLRVEGKRKILVKIFNHDFEINLMKKYC